MASYRAAPADTAMAPEARGESGTPASPWMYITFYVFCKVFFAALNALETLH
jgi:hypothetical protein